jgi:uncharacterized Ntn-hydrolase superfamily protein
MTYAILAAYPETGLIGFAQTTAPIAVGARCHQARSQVGIAVSQGNTQPNHAFAMIDALADGLTPDDCMSQIAALDPYFSRRQLALVTADGRAIAHTGADLNTFAGQHVGAGLAIIGNGLASGDVITRMRDAWAAGHGQLLERRLLTALTAGHDAGGDMNGHNSAVLKVMSGTYRWARTDLRIDWPSGAANGRDAVDDLGLLFDRYEPMIPYYEARAADPTIPDFETWRASAGGT